jgi:hypothetical protein
MLLRPMKVEFFFRHIWVPMLHHSKLQKLLLCSHARILRVLQVTAGAKQATWSVRGLELAFAYPKIIHGNGPHLKRFIVMTTLSADTELLCPKMALVLKRVSKHPIGNP